MCVGSVIAGRVSEHHIRHRLSIQRLSLARDLTVCWFGVAAPIRPTSKTGAALARPRESGGSTVMRALDRVSAANDKLRERNSRVCAKPWSVQTGRGRR